MGYIEDLKRKHLLQTFPQAGVGHLEIKPEDSGYFEHYDKLQDTSEGVALHRFRVEMVYKYTDKRTLDIGIGCGQFVNTHGNCSGYDIDKKSIAWLKDRGAFFDPYSETLDLFGAMTFWDSMEHISDPEHLLKRIGSQFVFVSMPIYSDTDSIVGHKHFKPSEHCWYFTEPGFVQFMKWNGFELLEVSDMETQLGRIDIKTFVLRRIRPIL